MENSRRNSRAGASSKVERLGAQDRVRFRTVGVGGSLCLSTAKLTDLLTIGPSVIPLVLRFDGPFSMDSWAWVLGSLSRGTHMASLRGWKLVPALRVTHWLARDILAKCPRWAKPRVGCGGDSNRR